MKRATGFLTIQRLTHPRGKTRCQIIQKDEKEKDEKEKDEKEDVALSNNVNEYHALL
jgi:hypothetical protein